MFKTWDAWKWALRVFLMAGSLVMFIGVLQHWVDPNMLLNQGSDRVASTLGNSIYVGDYGLFLFFVVALLVSREKNSVWNVVYSGLALLAVLGLIFSGTRGSLLGLMAGLGAMLVGYIMVLKNSPKVRWGLVGVLIAIVLSTSVLYAFRKTDFVSGLPAIGRTINTSLADVKASARWVAWDIAIQSWQERPFFGWGPNNFFYAFNAHYNPRSLNFGYGETWFDNAHNIIVNTMAVQGIVGIISYLAVFIVGAASLYLAFKKQGLNYHLAVMGAAFLAAHLVGNITVFENPT
jgi:O-antigen ligase